MVKTLVALATERMLLKTSGPTFLRGIEFMYAAGLAPDRLSVMMTSSHKYVLQFHSKCDIRPFAANYPNFGRVLRGIVHVREWRIKSIEFVNVAFYMRDVDNLERAIEKLGVELVLLRNCTYPGVQRGDEAVKFLSALNRKKQAVVCEYGDDRLKHRIGRRTSGHRARRASRNGQEVVVPPMDPLDPPIAPGGVQVAAAPVAPLPAARIIQRPLDPIPEAIPALNNEGGPRVRRHVPIQHQQQQLPIPAAPPVIPAAAAIPGAPLGRDMMAPMAGGVMPGSLQQVQLPEALVNQLPGRSQAGRVVVGAHVYEFRAVDVPNVDNIPAVQNRLQLNHLLHVLADHQRNDVRVIVLPPDQRGLVALQNDNNNIVFQRGLPPNSHQDIRAAVNAVGAAMPPAPEPPGIHQNAQQQVRQNLQNHRVVYANFPPQYQQNQRPAQQYIPNPAAHHQQQQMQQYQMGAHPYQQYLQPIHQQFGHVPMAQNNMQPPRQYIPPMQVPMFGVEGNGPLVQRAGDDSNDSTDREEMDEVEQPRHDPLRELVIEHPNFARVHGQADDLEELEEEEEEGEASEDDGMEDGSNEGQFMMVDQPEPVVP